MSQKEVKLNTRDKRLPKLKVTTQKHEGGRITQELKNLL